MPEFSTSEQKTATVVMSNPAVQAFDYDADLFLGADAIVKSTQSFHLDAGESKSISFPITMPSVVGVYPVYLSISSGGVLIVLYYAGDVTITALGLPAGYFALDGGWAKNVYGQSLYLFSRDGYIDIPMKIEILSNQGQHNMVVTLEGSEPNVHTSLRVYTDNRGQSSHTTVLPSSNRGYWLTALFPTVMDDYGNDHTIYIGIGLRIYLWNPLLEVWVNVLNL